MSANGSILSYGMKIRRDTAEEILDFVKSLARAPESGAPGGDRGFGPVETEASSALQDMQKRNAERVGQSISRPLTGGAALP
jgi:hypothetical protein